MIPRIAILLPLCFLVNGIPLEVYQRNIPVEVRYEGEVVRVIPREVQARRNLDAKVQLDSEELEQALKHLPVRAAEPQIEEKPLDIVKLSEKQDIVLIPQIVQDNVERQPEQIIAIKAAELPPAAEEIPAIKSLIHPESLENSENIQGKAALNPQYVPTQLDKVLQESHQIITSGLKNLRNSFRPGKGEFSPSSEQWATLEKAVETYFDQEKQKLLQVRQTQPGSGTDAAPAPAVPDQSQSTWISNIVNGFNGIASNFVQSIQSLGGANNGAPAPQGQGDEGAPQQPANQGFQGFVQFFNNGISNIVSTITGSNSNGPTTSNTNLSDSGSPPAQQGGPIAFFGAIVSNVQNALGIQQGQQPPSGSQGDTGAPVQQQQNGPLQVIQSVGASISNFFQGTTQNRPPIAAAGDEGSAPAPPSQPSNANIIQNIQNAIQNSPLNPFRPQGGTNNPNPVQNAIQSVGTQAQQLIPSGQSQSPDNVKKPDDLQPQPLQEALPISQPEKPVKENEILKKDTKVLPVASLI